MSSCSPHCIGKLHAFGDASGNGVAAAVYALVVQEKCVNQGLVASSRARLAKKVLTIPRLELVSGHMAVNLLSNESEPWPHQAS